MPIPIRMGKVYFRSQILEGPSIDLHLNICGVPVFFSSAIILAYLHGLDEASIIFKLTILEQEYNLVLYRRYNVLKLSIP